MKKIWLLLIPTIGLVLVALILNVGKVAAQTAPPTPMSPNTNQDCLTCHGQPGMQIKLASGEILYLSVDADTYDHSVHGGKGYACVQCHTNITGYPHPDLTSATRRDFSLELSQVCATCHQNMYDLAVNDAHTQARRAGKKEAAVCNDCHGAHDITPPTQPRSRIAQTCQRCHSQIFNLYKTSVHGAALIGEGNPDVPSCVDCHNAHNVQGPSNTQFRLFSPQICARCHENKAMMTKYGVNTDVFNTYIADFHGTTVEIFQSVAPGQETNKPVCIDCHGVHDMQKPGDPDSPAMKERLLVTCQKCHPGATANFPSAWMNHYLPSPEHYPIVYYVNLFYKLFIPGVLGGMAVFVVTDIGRRVYNARKRPSTTPRPEISKPPILTRPSPPSADVPTQPKASPAPQPESILAVQPEAESKEASPATQPESLPAVQPEPEPKEASPAPEEIPPSKIETVSEELPELKPADQVEEAAPVAEETPATKTAEHKPEAGIDHPQEEIKNE